MTIFRDNRRCIQNSIQLAVEIISDGLPPVLSDVCYIDFPCAEEEGEPVHILVVEVVVCRFNL